MLSLELTYPSLLDAVHVLEKCGVVKALAVTATGRAEASLVSDRGPVVVTLAAVVENAGVRVADDEEPCCGAAAASARSRSAA